MTSPVSEFRVLSLRERLSGSPAHFWDSVELSDGWGANRASVQVSLFLQSTPNASWTSSYSLSKPDFPAFSSFFPVALLSLSFSPGCPPKLSGNSDRSCVGSCLAFLPIVSLFFSLYDCLQKGKEGRYTMFFTADVLVPLCHLKKHASILHIAYSNSYYKLSRMTLMFATLYNLLKDKFQKLLKRFRLTATPSYWPLQSHRQISVWRCPVVHFK